ncbi:sulfotransferase family protein [Shewanella sp. SP1S2-4]|uniref:sulfotransferase family protein n=1 Tax=Shewanella sp. SP1S2-4 TaxID=3063537 RepID=UPI00288E4355|nr:sulfotransferase family protein [Shewanella sp. SP1S2-4]MDT3321978.1 sulfotransferase family protein [Shewanella sp. SP1S2-4]
MNPEQCYWSLVHNPAALRELGKATTMVGFCQYLRRFWCLPDYGDEALLAILWAGNRQTLAPDFSLLCQFWVPADYDPKRRVLEWMSAAEKPIHPFYSEHISAVRSQMLSALIRPRTPLLPLPDLSGFTAQVQPAGFIFHLSRCGSTLVSRSFAGLSKCRVLSESPLLTQVLLDRSLSDTERRAALTFCIDTQGQLFHPEQHLLIKWNAWDLQFWPLILSLYPQVPVLLLLRDPVEILASQQKSAGYHMVRQPSRPLFRELSVPEEESILEYQCKVLRLLLGYGLEMSQRSQVMVVDYQELLPVIANKIANWFSLALSKEECSQVEQCQLIHAKTATQPFVADSQSKQSFFSAKQKEQIHRYCNWSNPHLFETKS